MFLVCRFSNWLVCNAIGLNCFDELNIEMFLGIFDLFVEIICCLLDKFFPPHWLKILQCDCASCYFEIHLPLRRSSLGYFRSYSRLSLCFPCKLHWSSVLPILPPHSPNGTSALLTNASANYFPVSASTYGCGLKQPLKFIPLAGLLFSTQNLKIWFLF